MDKMVDVANDVTNQKKREEELGLTEEEYIFYEALSEGKEFVKSDDVLKSIAIEVTDFLKRNTTIDWLSQENVKAKIRTGVKRILLKSGFSPEAFEKLVPTIMMQAESNYAEV